MNGMATPPVVPLAELSVGGPRRNTIAHVAIPVKKDHKQENDKETGPSLLKRAATANAIRASPNVVRRKLPWLENAQAKTSSNDPPSSTDAAAYEEARGRNTISGPSDPIMSSISMESPSSSERNANGNEDLQAAAPLENARLSSSQRAFYASSDYSTLASDGEQSMPATLPRRDRSSYEKLVMDPQISRTQAQDIDRRDQMGTEAGLKPISNVSGSATFARKRSHGTRRPKPKPSSRLPYEDTSSTSDQRRRCKSCDASVSARPMHSKSPSPSHYSRGAHIQGRSLRKSDADTRHQPQMTTFAVTGLESLLEEALTVARTAAKAGRADEIASVLNPAAFVLKEPGSVQSRTARRPLRLSEQSSMRSSQSGKGDVSSNVSSSSRGRMSSHAPPVTQNGKLMKGRFRELEDVRDSGMRSSSSPKLHSAVSQDLIVRDFAYTKDKRTRRHSDSTVGQPLDYGAAASFYGDHGESVTVQPGVRKSVAGYDKLITAPEAIPARNARRTLGKEGRVLRAHQLRRDTPAVEAAVEEQDNPAEQARSLTPNESPNRQSPTQDTSHQNPFSDSAAGRDVQDERCNDDDSTPSSEMSRPRTSKTHVSLKDGDTFDANKYHKHRPIAREWTMGRKRLTAIIACLNTIFTGFIAGIYAGEVPRIQYQLADESHWAIFGNTLLFAGMGLTTLIFWPLPLLHGRRPYTLVAFALMLPCHIPQALTLNSRHDPGVLYRVGLLLPRALTGLALGFANINFLPTLWDLFGASLMEERPHQEFVMYDDVRRQGGGVGVWLGLWTFCFSSSLSIGFCVGACIISKLDPS